jgi:AcrR family transcriptional regulator
VTAAAEEHSTGAAELPARLRTTPQQARSQARIGAALNAAERLLACEGADSVTTTRVAAEAGMAVGSVYRYFPDKAAILDALASRFLREFETLMGEMVRRAGEETWDDPVGLLIDVYADYYRTQPALRAIWFGARLSDEMFEADRQHKRTMAEGLRRILVAQRIVRDTSKLATVTHAAVLTSDALMQEAFRSDPAGDRGLLTEAKAILRGYLADIAKRFGAQRKARR